MVSRALENEGIATTLTSWNAGRTRITMPARATFTNFDRGMTLGGIHNVEQQRRVLKMTLDLLAQDAPLEPLRLDEVV